MDGNRLQDRRRVSWKRTGLWTASRTVRSCDPGDERHAGFGVTHATVSKPKGLKMSQATFSSRIPQLKVKQQRGASFPLRKQWVCTSKEFASSGVMSRGPEMLRTECRI